MPGVNVCTNLLLIQMPAVDIVTRINPSDKLEIYQNISHVELNGNSEVL